MSAISARKFFKDNFFEITAILVASLNVWFAYKLGPIILDIRLLDNRVSAMENVDVVSASDLEEIVIHRLDRIENKLDTLLTK